MESRHKGKRRWVTYCGSTIAIIGLGIAILDPGGAILGFGVLIFGGLIILVNEGLSVLDRETDRGRMY